ATGDGVLDGRHDGVADAGVTATGATENTDAENLLGTRVVGDLQSRLLLNHSFSYRLTGSLPARGSAPAEPGGTGYGPCSAPPWTLPRRDVAADGSRAPKNPLPDSGTGVVNAGRSPLVRGLRRGRIGCPGSCRGIGRHHHGGGAQSSGNRSRLRPAPRTVTPAGRAPSCVLALLRPGSRPPPRPRAARRGPPAARLAPRRTFTRLVLSSPTVIVAAAPSRSSSHRSAIRSPDVEHGPGTRQGRSFLPMIDIDVARRLRDAGLPWEPTDGDLFAIDNALLREEAFMLSSMVVEVGRGRTGTRVLRFNGTTEWALDSVEQDEAVWLPREDQLREALGAAFSALRRREDGGFVVELRVGDGELR